MALSNAERQRLWRQKQRQDNYQAYCRKERTRKRGRYVPTHELTHQQQEERRKKCREDFRKHYIRKKKKQSKHVEKSPCGSPSTGVTTRSTEKLQVKLSFPGSSGKAVSVKKRHNRALRMAYRKIETLATKCVKLEKDKKRLQKRIERQGKSTNNEDNSNITFDTITNDRAELMTTPRSRTKLMLKKAGVRLNKKSEIRKRLVLGNAMIDAVKAKASKKKKSGSADIQIAASIIKKYRCVDMLSRQFGVTRRKISQLHYKRKSNSLKSKHREQVNYFLEREDNCTILPGKRDAIMKNKQATQKRVLNDYMHNLHQKFRLENPQIKLSRSSFCKLRPANLLLTSFASRRTCLCTYHQNFALKIKSMQKEGIKCSGNPDVFLKEFTTSESLAQTLTEKCSSDVKYRHWKKVSDGEKYRWKELEETVPKSDFIKIVLEESEKFRKHVERVQNQYTELRKLRENLPDNEVLLWMDFAENYTCSSVEEVQSAYWNTQMVSLHTMVVYFPQGHQKNVQSYVAMSDVLSHNATAVYTILKQVVPLLKEDFPSLQRIHYLTDSPTSQYRNRTIFQIVCEHELDFGVCARWNYLETGHGKGPCDGLGASVKRSADMAVKQQKCLIQDASDFYKWVDRDTNESKVRYVKYDENDIEEASEILKQKVPAQQIQGTMKIHAVVPVDSKTVATRDLSCYCTECRKDVISSTCSGWDIKSITKLANIQAHKSTETVEKSTGNERRCDEGAVAEDKEQALVKFDDWVAAVYDGDWYIGKVSELDTDDCQINFLTASGKYGKAYKFPATKDEIWVKKSEILVVLKELKEVGKSRRCYKLSEAEEKQIISKFDEMLQ